LPATKPQVRSLPSLIFGGISVLEVGHTEQVDYAKYKFIEESRHVSAELLDEITR